MKIRNKIRGLERKGIISRKPHLSIPFILALISLALGLAVKNLILHEFFSTAFFFLAGFSLVFALIHLVVVVILRDKKVFNLIEEF